MTFEELQHAKVCGTISNVDLIRGLIKAATPEQVKKEFRSQRIAGVLTIEEEFQIENILRHECIF